MSWRNKAFEISKFGRIALAFGLAGLCAGCFQPLYGSNSPVNGASVKDQLASVAVQEVEAPNGTAIARLGVEVRNSLIFDFTGGAGKAVNPTHVLKINMAQTRQQVIVDTTTARPDVENYGIDATYTLTDIAAKKIVVTGRTFSRVSFDIPGQQQRFAGARGLRDAENRAAQVVADQIKQRLASYFLAGT
jgi:LPS-assembly lipoprotein